MHIQHISKIGTKGSKKPSWFADKVSELHPETMYWVTVREGETIILPAGFFHSVYTPLDSIVFAGSFFYNEAIPISLKIHQEIEVNDINASLFPNYRQLFVRALFDFCSNYRTIHDLNISHVALMLKYCKEWVNDKSSKELDISQEISKILVVTKLDCGLSWIKQSATELASFAYETNLHKVVEELKMIIDDVNQEMNAINDITSKDNLNNQRMNDISESEFGSIMNQTIILLRLLLGLMMNV